MKFSIEPLSPVDVPAAQQLVEAAGWNQLPQDWLRLLHREPQGCFKATADGQLVGTVTTICYGTALAWIGMMLVHPTARRQGIGKQLMHAAIGVLQSRGIRAIGLDATPAGRPLYEQLGFSVAAEWQRWKRTAASATVQVTTSAAQSDTLNPAHHTPLRQLDTQAWGVERWSWIESLLQQSQVAVTLGGGTQGGGSPGGDTPHAGRQQGYGLLRAGRIASYLGPLVATDREVALQLSQQLLVDEVDECLWDVPPANPAAVALAQQLNFQPVRDLYRMWLGPSGPSGQPNHIYAISDPATG